MAERTRDAEDRLLDSMFQSQPIEDDGFSVRVVRRIRRRIWIQRLALPVAMLIGGAIALKPAMQLFSILSRYLGAMPQEAVAASLDSVPQLPMILLAGTLLVFAAVTFRMFEE